MDDKLADDVIIQGQKLAVLEKQVADLTDSVKEIQSDVRALLELWQKALGFVGVVKWILTVGAAGLAFFTYFKSWGR